MSLTQKLKTDLLTARKERDVTTSGILRVLLGEIEQVQVKTGVELPDEKIYSIIRKMIESNNVCIQNSTTIDFNGSVFKSTNVYTLESENEILSSYLPTLLTHDEILSLISPELQIEIISGDDKSIGKFTGQILKIIKEKGLSSNGNDVGNAIKEYKKNRIPSPSVFRR